MVPSLFGVCQILSDWKDNDGHADIQSQVFRDRINHVTPWIHASGDEPVNESFFTGVDRFMQPSIKNSLTSIHRSTSMTPLTKSNAQDKEHNPTR